MAFTATQVTRFRRAWSALHMLAAASALRYISPRQLARQLDAVHVYVRATCVSCAAHFQEDVPTLAACGPGAIERAMYDVHARASDATQKPPPFHSVQNHHRGALRNALRSDHLALSGLLALGEATAEGCDAVHLARLKYDLSAAATDVIMRPLQ